MQIYVNIESFMSGVRVSKLPPTASPWILWLWYRPLFDLPGENPHRRRENLQTWDLHAVRGDGGTGGGDGVLTTHRYVYMYDQNISPVIWCGKIVF